MRRTVFFLFLFVCQALYSAQITASALQDPHSNQGTVGGATWPLTSDERAAGVTGAQINPQIEPYNVRRYGGDPTGKVDSTVAMILAHSTGRTIYYTAGTYKFSSRVTIPCGGIVGDGAYKTILLSTDTGSTNLFTYTCATAGLFRDFQVETQGSKSGGFAIVVQPKNGEVSAMRFSQVVFNGVPSGIDFVAASLWSVIGCHFYRYTHDALTVNNTNNPDSGDSVVADSVFTSPGNNSSYAIHQIESGGLRIVGNKFNNGAGGIILDLGNTDTSDLLVTGNSFENAYSSAIQLQRLSGKASFANVVIVGNQFLLSSASGNSTGVYSSSGSAFLRNVTIVGNTFSVADSGAATAIHLDYVTNAVIEGNTIVGGTVGTNTEGIHLGAHNIGIKVGLNLVTGLKESLSAPPGQPYVASDYQSGRASVATKTAQGPLYTGTLSINFPKAWNSGAPPKLQNCMVAMTAAGGGGGVSVYPVSVTATTLVVAAAGTTNGGSVPIQWSCAGML